MNHLVLKTDKTKEMVSYFSRPSHVTFYVQPIDKMSFFKCLGTIFIDDLKWRVNSDAVFKNLIISRFFAFSKFISFYPSPNSRIILSRPSWAMLWEGFSFRYRIVSCNSTIIVNSLDVEPSFSGQTRTELLVRATLLHCCRLRLVSRKI